MTSNRDVSASSARSYKYNYRDNSYEEDGYEEFFASPTADKNDKDFSDVKVVENSERKD